jgi:hypothetical protein
MNDLEIRVDRLKRQFDEFKKNAEHHITLEPVAPREIERLRTLEYYPSDMLMILEQIGCMRNWGYRGCAMIDWWTPCEIEYATAMDRCVYNLSGSNFTSSASLLFFAWDCDARCYFYEISTIPWEVVVCDGLSIAHHGDQVTPWKDEDAPDALSVIENWALSNGEDLYSTMQK